MIKSTEYTQQIKTEATRLGFSFCGIAKAEYLEEESPRLEKWLSQNMHGKMQYMENYFEKRLDPTKLVEGSKSVVTLMYNYFPEKEQRDDSFNISKYAYGQDYHAIIKKKLKEFVSFIHEEVGEVNAQIYVDSAPVLERAWAKKSGLGWIGKNAMLIHPKNGSFFFLAEVILDLELEYDNPIKDYCGTCTACIDACPTEAILPGKVVDGSKCISYFTIELKDEIIPNEVKGKFNDWMFGCDICQDVCPWNRFSKPHNEKLFNPHPKLLEYSKNEWMDLTEEIYQEIFKKSAVKRTKFKGIKRNIDFLNKN
ncbi:tRNA epoxyqueuosine(34) reductase QueG [Vicingus serpentipes]|uniref:Epoxyqueuosine reductase n=1 Tax=Vicingus serpentipes TaxID=1926625 RepID=A0A5C6S002_9FLAO|nr:tRNA epoxyqueuosine(34) reductase QueG [Vicingus serpentipes]TXB67210.1 tRNA epoxyqueuosine(34) reductase QueG [Vicingus serpentipes]